jgi:hypothetical protein
MAGAISRAHRDPMRARVFILFLRTLPNLTLVPIDEALAEQATEIAVDARLRALMRSMSPWPDAMGQRSSLSMPNSAPALLRSSQR